MEDLSQYSDDQLIQMLNPPQTGFNSPFARRAFGIGGGIAGGLMTPPPFEAGGFAVGSEVAENVRRGLAGEHPISELVQHPFRSTVSTTGHLLGNTALGAVAGAGGKVAGGVLEKVAPAFIKSAAVPGMARTLFSGIKGAAGGGTAGAVQGAVQAPWGQKLQSAEQGLKEGAMIGGGIGTAVQGTADFSRLVRGNKATISGFEAQKATAESEQGQAAHERGQTYRRTPEGVPSPLSQAMSAKEKAIMEPAYQAADSVPEMISRDQINAHVDNLTAGDKATNSQVKDFIDNELLSSEKARVAGGGTKEGLSMSRSDFQNLLLKNPNADYSVMESSRLSPEELSRTEGYASRQLMDKATELYQGISKSARSGATPFTPDQRIVAIARRALLNSIEENVPNESKGIISDQFNKYSLHLADKKQITDYFSPGERHTAPTDAGDRLLINAAKGKLSPSEKEFLDRFEKDYGEHPAEPLKPFAQRISAAEEGIQKAKRSATIAQMFGRWGMRFGLLYPILRMIRNMFGK